MRSIAFYRSFRRFQGGHLKVWDYFCHTLKTDTFRPTVYFARDSLLDHSNPWVASGVSIETKWTPNNADALFIGGTDWLSVPETYAKPVINLVQHVRHADPTDARYRFLSRRAVRICYSRPVAEALKATGKVNGPVIFVPLGLDWDIVPNATEEKDIAILISGLKQPQLAAQISAQLSSQGISCLALSSLIPRDEYLQLLRRAKVSVFLPNTTEGFYIPALEGMAVGTLVVCPDCVGNREFCFHGVNSYMPDYSASAIVEACMEALNLDEAARSKLLKNGCLQAGLHTLEAERSRYVEVLEAAFAEEI